MRVHTTKEVLDPQDIADILQRHERDFVSHVLELKDYYAGKHKILMKEQLSAHPTTRSSRIIASTSPT